MIIPLAVQRRQRGLELWESAGRMMGVDRSAGKGKIDLTKFTASTTGATGTPVVANALSRELQEQKLCGR